MTPWVMFGVHWNRALASPLRGVSVYDTTTVMPLSPSRMPLFLIPGEASRAGTLGQRKAAAMRIAERVLEEQILTGQMATSTPYGTIVDGDVAYPWTMRSDPWAEDTTISGTFDLVN